MTCHRTLPSPAPEGFFHARFRRGGHPGPRIALDPQARGLPEGTSRRQRRQQPTAGWERCSPSAIQFVVALVQAARTPECDSGGRGFESRTSPQFRRISSVAGSVSRPPFFPGGRAPEPAGEQINHALIAQLESEHRNTTPGVRGSSPRERASSSRASPSGRRHRLVEPASTGSNPVVRASLRVHRLVARIQAPQAWDAGSSPAGRTTIPDGWPSGLRHRGANAEGTCPAGSNPAPSAGFHGA